MNQNRSPVGATGWIALVAVLGLTGLLGWALVQPGLTTARAALVALVGVVAWMGAGGVVLDRPLVTVASAVVLFLLGFWQAVLWVGILPAGLALLVAGLVAAGRSGGATGETAA